VYRVVGVSCRCCDSIIGVSESKCPSCGRRVS